MLNLLSLKPEKLYNSRLFPWIIIITGIALRLIRYLHNPSLSFDEAGTAIDLLNRSFSELFEVSLNDTLSYPYGFLALVKISVTIFGNSEYAFRLIPLLFGILSPVLFYAVAKYYLNHKAVPIALALFAVSDPLIIYATNLTPYSSDVAFSTLLLIVAIYARAGNLSILNWFVCGLLGAVVVWFSNSSLFILSGIGVSLALFYLRKKEWINIGRLFIMLSISAASFSTYYYLYVRKLIANLGISIEQQLIMERALMPFPPSSISDIKWYVENFLGVFDNPLDFTLAGIAVLAFLVGCIAIKKENKEKFLLLTAPVFFTIFAAVLHMYPFKGRLILFLVPIFLLFIAEGASKIFEKLNYNSAVAGTIFVGLLFFHPVSWAAYHVKKPFSAEEIKPVLKYIEKRWVDGDVLYVHYYSQYAFEYYSKHYPEPFNFAGDNFIVGIAPRGWYRMWKRQDVHKYYDANDSTLQTSVNILKKYVEDLNKLRGNKRVWLLFSAGIDKDGINEEKFFVFQLETMGKRIDSFGRPEIASAYLYDLSVNEPQTIK